MVFRRRRNIAILGVLAGVPVLIAIAVKIATRHGRNASDGGAFFGNITTNGVFVAFAALLAVLPLFLPMAVSVVAGEAVAGEASSGTLRYLLTVPVSRSRLLAVKYASLLAWSVAATFVVALSGTLVGLLLFGGGEVTLLSGTSVPLESGLFRLLLVVGYIAVMVAVLGAIGLFVSTLTEVPIAAMATTLALTITSQVLDAVPQLGAIHPWLPSHYWLRFDDFMRDPLTLERVQHGLAVSLGYIAVFLLLAWARFGNKDVTS